MRKLEITSGMRILVIDEPEPYAELVEGLPADVEFVRGGGPVDLVHMFTRVRDVLEHRLPVLREHISPDGMIWVSWPKRAARVDTDVSEDVVRQVALASGLVDVKVCAVDEVWSGLKLVIPRALRPRSGGGSDGR